MTEDQPFNKMNFYSTTKIARSVLEIAHRLMNLQKCYL